MQKDTIFTLSKNLKDKKSLAIQENLQHIAHLNNSLLIYGETGVGKDFWVHYLFALGNTTTLLNLHCGDVPENLLESEWFGYKRGAFTGADHDYDGKWKKADGGILFLNQIDLLSPNMQSKILRIIERKKYYPLGSNEEKEINARFVFSCSEDIEQKVRDGLFRKDLFYRIASYNLLVPPLRQRKDDIMPLIHYFATQKQLSVSLDKKAINVLNDYPWPGNIREIENFITTISINKSSLTNTDAFALLKTTQDFFETIKTTEPSMEQLENQYIDFLLRKYKNKVTVAKILNISRKSLYNKLHKKNMPEN